METQKSLSPIIKIAKYTFTDEVKQKSFLVLLGICSLFVFLLRGCYHGNYMVNGQVLDARTTIGVVSKLTFHIIASGTMLIAGLFSMRVFKRDRDNGMQACILSKPINRWHYVIGKIMGLWVLSVLFMSILHGILFLITSVNLQTVMPGYLFGSLLCSFNLLFVVITVLLFTLLMSDIVAFLSVMGIAIVGSVADGIYAFSHSPMAQTMMQQGSNPQSDLSVWKVIFYLWPKLSGTQHLATSLFISHDGFNGLESLYPLVNILLYCLILGTLLLYRFKKEEIV